MRDLYPAVSHIQIGERCIDDWRAHLVWTDGRKNYEIRGYGDSPGKAADDAYRRFLEDREFHTSDSWLIES